MPGHYKDPKIYDLIASQAMSDTTITQLNNATKNTFIEERNVEFWSGVITVARALEESRTFAQGSLPIPETGIVVTTTIANGENASVMPTGTEIWQIMGIEIDNCSFTLVDADGNTCDITPQSSNRLEGLGPLYLSATMGFKIFNGSGSEQTPKIAYFKVSL